MTQLQQLQHKNKQAKVIKFAFAIKIKKMKKYKFLKNQSHYKKDEIIEVEKPNKLLKQWLKLNIISLLK